MDSIINIIREWNGVAQFVIILVLAAGIAGAVTILFSTIDRFINKTLPIIIRGWPPNYVEEKDDDEKSDD